MPGPRRLCVLAALRLRRRYIPPSAPPSGGGGAPQVPPLQSPESQMLPQRPQLFASDDTFVHPPEHAMSPGAHPQDPPFATALHASPETGHAPHAAPPAPHEAALCEPKSSQVEPLQQPDGHEAAVHWQIAETHCCIAPQRSPHEPQLAASVLVLTHEPGTPGPLPQSVGVAAGHTHAPPVQLAAAGHGRPQPPQLLLSELDIDSQPFAALMSQLA